MRILNDEEIHRAKFGYGDVNPHYYLTRESKAIAKAQHRQDLKDTLTALNSGHSIDYIRECFEDFLKQLEEVSDG